MADISEIFGTLTPILAGGTLLGLASLRQSDVATRSRSIVDEYLYKKPSDDRKKGLKLQNEKFKSRYKWLKVASIFLSLAITTQLVIAVLTAVNGWDSTLRLGLILSLGFFALGVCCLMREFIVGTETLEINSELLK